MEPTQHENTVPESSYPTTRKHAVVSPMLSLPNRFHETNKNTAIDLPIADIPTRSLKEDTKQFHSPTDVSSSPTHMLASATPVQRENTSRMPSSPPHNSQKVPASRPQESVKEEELSPLKLVRVLPPRPSTNHL